MKGNPKERRPLALKKPMHLVLKSRHAFGKNSMLAKAHVKQIDQLVRRQARACGVKIYHFVNVGNHLHLVILLHNRELYCVFIRAISGLIAKQILGSTRAPATNRTSTANNQGSSKGQFWLARPFSRIVTWGKDFRGLGHYMQKNQAQANQSGARLSEESAPAVLGFGLTLNDEMNLQLSLLSTA